MNFYKRIGLTSEHEKNKQMIKSWTIFIYDTKLVIFYLCSFFVIVLLRRDEGWRKNKIKDEIWKVVQLKDFLLK